MESIILDFAPKMAIFGGCGYVGSHFVKFLQHHHPDWELYIIDNHIALEDMGVSGTAAINVGRQESDQLFLYKYFILHGITHVVNLMDESNHKLPDGMSIASRFARQNFSFQNTIILAAIDAVHENRTIENADKQIHYVQLFDYDMLLGNIDLMYERIDDIVTPPLQPRNTHAAAMGAAYLNLRALHTEKSLHTTALCSGIIYGGDMPAWHPLESCIDKLTKRISPDLEYMRADEYVHIEDVCTFIRDLIETEFFHYGQSDYLHICTTHQLRSNVQLAHIICHELDQLSLGEFSHADLLGWMKGVDADDRTPDIDRVFTYTNAMESTEVSIDDFMRERTAQHYLNNLTNN